MAKAASPWYERRVPRLLLGCLPFLCFFAAWEILSLEHIRDLRYALPSLSATFKALRSDLGAGYVYHALWVTVQEIGLALVIATAAGVLLGVAMGLVRPVEVAFYPMVVMFQAIPKPALAPVLILIFGFGIGAKVAVAASTAFFPILLATVLGMRSTRADELDLMQSLNASRLQVFAKVRVQRALPAIFSGFQVAALFAMLAAVVTEFLGATSGVGYLIQVRSTQLNTAGSFSALTLLAVLGLAMTLGLAALGRRLARWEE